MYINKIIHEYGVEFSLDINNISIPENTIIGLVGENGAGKTTLMSILAQYLKPNKIFEIQHSKDNYSVLYIPSDAEAYDYLTVGEFLNVVKKYSDTTLDVDEMLGILELSEKIDCTIDELSQGMRKKLTLIPLFIKDYDLIILDEPFNSIDLNYIYKLKKIIKGLKKRSSILISSHILETLVDLCDSFILISKGKVIKTFKNDNDIKKVEGEIFDKNT